MSFEDFQRVEKRKAFQGMYQGTDYFVRFVKEWHELNEHYGDVCYSNAGYAKITAQVSNKAKPCSLPAFTSWKKSESSKDPRLMPIKEVSSFRGRFCEQAEIGEIITAQGKVELVTDKRSKGRYYRLILGNKPEDYMVLGKV